ncbi:MAG: serine/threonine protein kinase [Lentisphaeria bacterium]|nr:serine/threonine protein kinase [Lentisphaeria bacterium]
MPDIDKINEADFTPPFDPSRTVAGTSSGEEITDCRQLRESCLIYSGEDGSLYRDFKLLGMGGMGVVYSAEDPTLERKVAVKLLREPYRFKREHIAKFVNEARITARIDHPNIIAVHQLGVDKNNGVYFSMRKISGETLLHAIRRLRDGDAEARRIYTRRRLVDIFIAGCNAVAAAHEKKILHCDLKPSNIMIGSFGEVSVLDWGLAREFGVPFGQERSISGTPAFMAPELVTGEFSGPDEKTDVYALGTILFSILTWQPSPFDMSLEKEVLMEMVASGRTLPLRAPHGQKISRELAAICRKAMSHDRSERYSTVAELLEDLHNFRDGYAVGAYSPNIFYRFFKLCRRRPVVPIAVIAALLTVWIHESTVAVADFIQDRALLRSSVINMRIADNYYRSSISSAVVQPEQRGENLLQLVIRQKDFEMRSQLALMEYFSIIDTSNALSPGGRDEFAANYGADIFRKILNLQIRQGDSGKVEDILERCRRSELFEASLKYDRVLAEQVREIREGTGTVFLNSDGGDIDPEVELLHPDGSLERVILSEKRALKLKKGEYRATLKNGVKLYFDIVPGCRERIEIPAVSPDAGTLLIPSGKFQTKLPLTGSAQCYLTAFLIRKKPLPGSFSPAEAAETVKKYPGWRLPYFAELLKVWQHDSKGRGLFDVEVPDIPVLLQNGEFFDPASGRSVKQIFCQRGAVYLVKDI